MAKKLLGRVEIKELIEERIAALPERYSECRGARVMGLEERDPAQCPANWTVQISAQSEVCRRQAEAIVRGVMDEFDCNLEVDRIQKSDDDGYIVSNLRAFVSGAHYIGVVVTDEQEAAFHEALRARRDGDHLHALELSKELRALRIPHENPTRDIWVEGAEAARVASLRDALVKHGIELAGDRPDVQSASEKG